MIQNNAPNFPGYFDNKKRLGEFRGIGGFGKECETTIVKFQSRQKHSFLLTTTKLTTKTTALHFKGTCLKITWYPLKPSAKIQSGENNSLNVS